ncbi:hypothetical protein D3C84_1202730 [compost metagenome]
MILAADLHADHFHQYLIIQLFRCVKVNFRHTLTHIHAAEAGSCNEIIFGELRDHTIDIS